MRRHFLKEVHPMILKPWVLKLFGTFLFSLWVISSATAATESFDQSYQVEPATKLEVRNRNGNVTIQCWDQRHVKVNATKKTSWGGKLDNVEIRVTQNDTMTIETIHLVKNPRVSVTYDIRVPSNVLVSHVHTSNGGIEIEGTQGDAVVETSNGRIELHDVHGDIQAMTSNGKIEIEKVKGFVSAETSNGSIEITRVSGIKRAETSNGSIEAEIQAIHDDRLQIRTSNGSIELHLFAEIDADIEMRTSNGKITLHGLDIVAREISKTALKGKIGKGGPTIYGKTSNGSIHLYKLKE
jgi:DUF4097 and DUF4098 domain-containing protein YvlB